MAIKRRALTLSMAFIVLFAVGVHLFGQARTGIEPWPEGAAIDGVVGFHKGIALFSSEKGANVVTVEGISVRDAVIPAPVSVIDIETASGGDLLVLVETVYGHEVWRLGTKGWEEEAETPDGRWKSVVTSASDLLLEEEQPGKVAVRRDGEWRVFNTDPELMSEEIRFEVMRLHEWLGHPYKPFLKDGSVVVEGDDLFLLFGVEDGEWGTVWLSIGLYGGAIWAYEQTPFPIRKYWFEGRLLCAVEFDSLEDMSTVWCLDEPTEGLCFAENCKSREGLALPGIPKMRELGEAHDRTSGILKVDGWMDWIAGKTTEMLYFSKEDSLYSWKLGGSPVLEVNTEGLSKRSAVATGETLWSWEGTRIWRYREGKWACGDLSRPMDRMSEACAEMGE